MFTAEGDESEDSVPSDQARPIVTLALAALYRACRMMSDDSCYAGAYGLHPRRAVLVQHIPAW